MNIFPWQRVQSSYLPSSLSRFLIICEPSNTWYKYPASPCIFSVRVPVHLHQKPLFARNPIREELGRSSCVHNGAKGVAEHKLRADAPVEPPRVGRMTEVPIYACGHKRVPFRPPQLHDVTEASSRVPHGCAPRRLSSRYDKAARYPTRFPWEDLPIPSQQCREGPPSPEFRTPCKEGGGICSAVVDHAGVGAYGGVVHWVGARRNEEFEEMEGAEEHDVGRPLEGVGKIMGEEEE